MDTLNARMIGVMQSKRSRWFWENCYFWCLLGVYVSFAESTSWVSKMIND